MQLFFGDSALLRPPPADATRQRADDGRNRGGRPSAKASASSAVGEHRRRGCPCSGRRATRRPEGARSRERRRDQRPRTLEGGDSAARAVLLKILTDVDRQLRRRKRPLAALRRQIARDHRRVLARSGVNAPEQRLRAARGGIGLGGGERLDRTSTAAPPRSASQASGGRGAQDGQVVFAGEDAAR